MLFVSQIFDEFIGNTINYDLFLFKDNLLKSSSLSSFIFGSALMVALSQLFPLYKMTVSSTRDTYLPVFLLFRTLSND